MSTLLNALSEGSYDLQNKRDLSTNFSRDLLKYRNAVVSDYYKFKVPLNKAIAKIAKEKNFNDDQIQRVVEEVNNQVYLIEYDKTKGRTDRTVEFDIASLKGVKGEISGNGTKQEDKPKETQTEGQQLTKKAFETVKYGEGLEKVASFDSGNGDAFSKVAHGWGDLSVFEKETHEDFLIKRIDEKVANERNIIEDKTQAISNKIGNIADVIIGCEKVAQNSGEVNRYIRKVAGEKIYSIIKEATESTIADLKQNKSLPENFSVCYDLSMEKKASEKFSLGKFSSIKAEPVFIPNLLIKNGLVKIANFNDFDKEVNSLIDDINSFKVANEEFKAMSEKVADVKENYMEKKAKSLEESISKLNSFANNNTPNAKPINFETPNNPPSNTPVPNPSPNPNPGVKDVTNTTTAEPPKAPNMVKNVTNTTTAEPPKAPNMVKNVTETSANNNANVKQSMFKKALRKF